MQGKLNSQQVNKIWKVMEPLPDQKYSLTAGCIKRYLA